MIPPDCKWTTPRAKPPGKRGARNVTPAMRAANAANGAKGAGKKSEAGRIASSLNSLKHGMSCKKLIFLGDEVVRAPEGADSAVVEAPRQAETPAGTDAFRNEAVAPEVIGRIRDNDPVLLAPVVSPTAPAATELDPFEAIVEKYKKVFDELRQYDHLE